MNIAIQLEPGAGKLPDVKYTWDPDTEILSAQLRSKGAGQGMSGSIEIEGSDGSWLILDIAAGAIAGVEIAVWPEVRRLAALAPPREVEDARVVLPSRRSQPDIASLEMDTALVAESDPAQTVLHFRLGAPRPVRAVRLARDVLVEVDGRNHLAGLWLLNVPPAPVSA